MNKCHLDGFCQFNPKIARYIVFAFTFLLLYTNAYIDRAFATHTPPTGLHASSNTYECSNLDVAWNGQGSGYTYTVRRYENGNLYGIVYTGTSSSFPDINLKTRVNYEYTVISTSGSDSSGYSSKSDSITTDCRWYHYGGQKTYLNGKDYYGWAGIKGSLSAPYPSPYVTDICSDFTAAYLNAEFNVSPKHWFQIGWNKGYHPDGGCPDNNIYLYYEHRSIFTDPQQAFYQTLYSEGSQAPNSYHFYAVGIKASTGSGYEYAVLLDGMNSSNIVDVAYFSKPSAMMRAQGEAYNTLDNGADMGLSWFGYNYNLDLRGASGWVSWSSTVGTRTYDERNSYYQSTANSYYKFRICGPFNCP